MTDDFNTNESRTLQGVGFKEYVIINTISEDNPDNGKIFRRGLNPLSSETISYYDTQTQQNVQIPSYGAEYICKITGSIGTSAIGKPAKIALNTSSEYSVQKDLQTDGVWFIAERY